MSAVIEGSRVIATLARRYAAARVETDALWAAVRDARIRKAWDEDLVYRYALGLRRCWRLRVRLAELLGAPIERGAA